MQYILRLRLRHETGDLKNLDQKGMSLFIGTGNLHAAAGILPLHGLKQTVYLTLMTSTNSCDLHTDNFINLNLVQEKIMQFIVTCRFQSISNYTTQAFLSILGKI